MTDLELARALERGDVSNADFHHESHLRVAWVYLNESTSLADATEVLNMRVQTAEQVCAALLNTELKPNLPAGKATQPSPAELPAGETVAPMTNS